MNTKQEIRELTRGLRASAIAIAILTQRLDKLENIPADPELDQIIANLKKGRTNP